MSGRINVRVYYEDTDAGGIVYYANYLKFAERGRTELLREVGFESQAMKEEQGLIFVVTRIEADYISSAKLDDKLEVVTTIETMKKVSFIMDQSIFCHDKLLFKMKVTLAYVSLSGTPSRIPQDIADALVSH